MSRCGLVILAAGGSVRLGKPKQLLDIQGTTLLRRCAQTALATACRPIFVVLGSRADELQKQLNDLPVTIVLNPNWQAGIGSSIRVGAAAISKINPPCDAIVLLPVDQPLVTAGAIDRLVTAHEKAGKLITAAAYADTLGTPAVFSITLLEELLSLPEDAGGKSLIKRHAPDVHPVDLPEAAFDIDTDADFIRLTAILAASTR